MDLGVAAAQLPTEKLSGDALASAITAGLADAGLASRSSSSPPPLLLLPLPVSLLYTHSPAHTSRSATEVEKMLANDNGVHHSVRGCPARASCGAPRVRAGAHGSGAARRWI